MIWSDGSQNCSNKILEFAKHPLVKALAESFDGKSLVPLFSEADANWPDRELFWHYPGYRISNPRTMAGQRPESAMRLGKWKMIESLETGSVQLYDLVTDIGESNDVSASHPEVVSQLRQRLQQWRVNTDAPMPKRKDADSAQTSESQSLNNGKGGLPNE